MNNKLAAYEAFLDELKTYLLFRMNEQADEYDYFLMGVSAEAKTVLEKITNFQAQQK